MPNQPIVLHDPIITMDPDYDGTPAPVDVSCHVIGVTPTNDADEVDVGSYCNPGATVQGPPSFGVDLDWRINDDTQTVLAALVGNVVQVEVVPFTGSTVKWVGIMDMGSVNPAGLGSMVGGEAVEAATSHSLQAEPSWQATV